MTTRTQHTYAAKPEGDGTSYEVVIEGETYMDDYPIAHDLEQRYAELIANSLNSRAAMLAALEAIVGLADMPSSNSHIRLQAISENARAAIRQARGEEVK